MSTRSRVTPGMSWTIEIVFPDSAFNSELLPTFGRPTMATTGIAGIRGHCTGTGAERMNAEG
jgi:hypothetical protein